MPKISNPFVFQQPGTGTDNYIDGGPTRAGLEEIRSKVNLAPYVFATVAQAQAETYSEPESAVIVETGLLYHYDADGTQTDDGLRVLTVTAGGRLIAICGVTLDAASNTVSIGASIYDLDTDSFGIGGAPNEKLTVDGGLSLAELDDDLTLSSGYGKVFYVGDSHTKLLISSDTSDGSTVFTDRSQYEHSITPVGDVHHEIDQAKFGATSISFDGSGDILTLADSDDWDFGTDDFTIDLWVYVIANGSNGILGRLPGGNADGFGLAINSSGYLALYNGAWSLTSADQITTGSWHHIAVIRADGYIKFYIDGTQSGVSYSGSLRDNDRSLSIGDMYISSTAWAFNGYMDEIRIINGAAMWTENFTPPSAPYANLNKLYFMDSTGNKTWLNKTRYYAGCQVTSPAATNTITAGTARNIFENSTIASTGFDVGFTVDNPGKRIVCNGDAGIFEVACSVSAESSVKDIVIDLFLYKNGTQHDAYGAAASIDAVGNIINMSLIETLTMESDDYVEIFVDIDAGTSTVNPVHATLTIKEV